MAVADEITRALTEGLSPEKIEVINDSHLHAGHAGDDGSGETHFRITVVSGKFEGVSRVQRQRMIFDLLRKSLKILPHAIQMHAMTPAEHTNKDR